MSKSRKSRSAATKPASAVDSAMLAQYRRAARVPTIREEIRTLTLRIDDYQGLVTSGNLTHALGAGLELVDLGLRIAATPAATALERQYKAGFFELHFGSMMRSFSHGHVARIADAAVAAEALAANTLRAR